MNLIAHTPYDSASWLPPGAEAFKGLEVWSPASHDHGRLTATNEMPDDDEMQQVLEEFLPGAIRGEDDAWSGLVKYFHRPVLQFVYKLNVKGNMQDAEDITQQVFASVHKAIGSFDRKRSFWGWLCGIARKKVIDQGRRDSSLKRGGDVVVESTDATHEDGVSKKVNPPSDALSPDEQSRLSEESEMLHSALDELEKTECTMQCRTVLELKYLGGLKNVEIAQEMEIPEKTVSTRLFRCKKRLAALVLARGYQR